MLYIKWILIVGLTLPQHQNLQTTRNKFISQWYEYVGGNILDPSSYQVATDGDPGCSGYDQLCGIRVKCGYDGRPDFLSLLALVLESQSMTWPGTYKDGVVELTNSY